jgi:hypothetical protein
MQSFSTSLHLLFPVPPLIPDPEPTAVVASYNYEQLKAYRLASQPRLVRAHYDVVQSMIEDAIERRLEQQYFEWVVWVRANL